MKIKDELFNGEFGLITGNKVRFIERSKTVEEIKIAENYKWLDRQFKLHSKPTIEMRKVQQEIRELKKKLNFYRVTKEQENK